MKRKRNPGLLKKAANVPIKKAIVKKKVTSTILCDLNRWYDMGKVIEWIESTTNLDFRSPLSLTPEQIELRNKKLFPFIKETFLYYE